ncbi:MAG: hypothetical protein ACYCX4_03345 [Bacillota bacterium]
MNKLKYPAFFLLAVLVAGSIALAAWERTQDYISVSIGIGGQGHYTPVVDQALLKELEQALALPPEPASGMMLAIRSVQINSVDDTSRYYFWGDYLIDQTKPERFKLEPGTAKALGSLFDRLDSIYYGQDIPWNEVKKKFLPRFGKAQVIDLETGLSFQVQRRAGGYHADVQPLTAQDTATMKEIYSGLWSWRRRAVLVKVNDINIAASMNGMPHGAGAIRGNNFPGHFCIHFSGSQVHTSRSVDLAHQMMVKKAAGKLEKTIGQAQPEELAAIFYTALKQHDRSMAGLALNFRTREELARFEEQFDKVGEIIDFRVKEEQAKDQAEQNRITVDLTRQKPGEHTFTKSKEQLVIYRDKHLNRWFIEASSVKL